MSRPKLPPSLFEPVLGREIRRHAARRGLLIGAVATAATLDLPTLEAMLAGRLVPNPRQLRALARALRVEVDQLLVAEDEIDAGTSYAAELTPLVADCMADGEETDVWAAVLASLLRLPAAERERLLPQLVRLLLSPERYHGPV